MKTRLKLNKSSATTLNFTVAVSGTVDEQYVRLYLTGKKPYEIVLDCEQNDNEWKVVVPNELATEDITGFYIEVFMDGYTSRPVEGGVDLLSTPVVKFAGEDDEDENEDEDEKPKKSSKKKLKEDHPPVIDLDVPLIEKKKYVVGDIIQSVLFGTAINSKSGSSKKSLSDYIRDNN